MKKIALWAMCIAVMVLSGCRKAPEWKAEHVFVIGLDGWGAYSVEKADMPNVKALMDAGCYTLKKRSVLPSSSAVNWASMFMGAGPELHGYTEWGSRTPELPSRVLNEHGIFPTVFSELRKAAPDAEMGVLYEWDGIKYLVDTLALNHHAQAPDYNTHPTALCDMACEYITQKKPVLSAFCFDNPDHVGHGDGHDTPAYYAKLKELDGYVAVLWMPSRKRVFMKTASLLSPLIMGESIRDMAERPWRRWKRRSLSPERTSRRGELSKRA